MFPFLRQDAAQLQLYGKLPLAKDYLRLGCGDGLAFALRTWLDASFSVGMDAGKAPELARPMRFLLRAGRAQPLLGCAWPSSDTGGLRKFPFVLLIERRLRELADDQRQDLCASASVWAELERVRARCDEHPDGRALLADLRSLQLKLGALTPAPARSVDLDTWIKALWPSEQAGGLARVIEQLAAVPRSQRRAARLPLVADLPAREQALAWLAVLAELDWCADNLAASLFLPMEGMLESTRDAPSFLLVLAGAPGAGDAAWLEAPVEAGKLGPADLAFLAPAFADEKQDAPADAPALRLAVRSAAQAVLARVGRAT